MTEQVQIRHPGPGHDLESFYIKQPISLLPDPPGIPFNKQGMPIPDIQQIHTSYREVDHAIHPDDPNPLPYKYWIGTSRRQINRGGPSFSLGVNENRK